MTITLKPRVECDGCREMRSGRDGENVFDFRARLRGEGWNHPSGAEFSRRDFCPRCVAEGIDK